MFVLAGPPDLFRGSRIVTALLLDIWVDVETERRHLPVVGWAFSAVGAWIRSTAAEKLFRAAGADVELSSSRTAQVAAVRHADGDVSAVLDRCIPEADVPLLWFFWCAEEERYEINFKP